METKYKRMKTIKQIANFLETFVIECGPEDGCLRCNEARECLDSLHRMGTTKDIPTEEEFTNKMAEIDCNTTDFFDWASQLYIWFCNRIKGEKK